MPIDPVSTFICYGVTVGVFCGVCKCRDGDPGSELKSCGAAEAPWRSRSSLCLQSASPTRQRQNLRSDGGKKEFYDGDVVPNTPPL